MYDGFMDLNQVTGQIVSAAFKIHSALGPGLLESAYRSCMKHELGSRGLKVQTEEPIPIRFDGLVLDVGFRTDLTVEDLVIVELKAIKRLLPIHEAQLLSYLKSSQRPVGLLINFHVPALRDGIRRRILL